MIPVKTGDCVVKVYTGLKYPTHFDEFMRFGNTHLPASIGICN